ncbi:MAG: DUF4867 family protein [Clostridia bacterium]|nr:DUF4867 family protein [Clostridia bacterium]
MKIYRVTDKEFLPFGRVLSLDTEEIVKEGEKVQMPREGSQYVPSKAEFEALPIMKTIQNECFGELPTQLGYCWGHSNMLNALEWHKCSEVNIAVTDLILLLGDVRDLEEGNKYDSAKVKAFRVLKGEAIEVYATTLHFCPIEVSASGFGCVVGLLKGTNTDLELAPEDKRLFRKNKWIIAHNENKALLDKGVVGGIYGVNHKICEE